MRKAQRKYLEKLRDPRWQKKRLQILERDLFSCRICGDSESPLNVHHLYYCRNRAPWDYPHWALISLCEECHSNDENRDKTDWEALLEIFTNNLPIELEFAHGGMADIVNQMEMAMTGGATHRECLMVLVEAITKFNKENALSVS